MKHKVFSIHDNKASAFLPPFFLPQLGMALRVFTNCINESTHQFNKNPEDFTLFEIGEFDDEHGTLVPISPKSHGVGVEFIKTGSQAE
jgi:hypothetical protein